MSKTILNVKPISQLFPLPLVMGCEGVSAAMLLQYNHHTTKATDIMKNWPTHKNNPYKGYVGHQLFIKFGHHQTIFPEAFVPHLQQFDAR
ncbi:MAG: C39 family peptidase, partial [Staphylococcus lugdunensis]|nr:C39 family peptidase [Staphylococcus lugdunensis]